MFNEKGRKKHMAFDDLTPNQSKTLIQVIEALNTGNYADEFAIARTVGKPQGFAYLYGIGGVSNKEIEGFTDTDVQALKDEGYIISISGGRASLKPKAFQQYRLLKYPLALYPGLEVAPNMRPDFDSSVCEPPKHGEDAAAKYIYLDVVGFTHDRTLEAQSDIIEKLNAIVSVAVEEKGVPDDKLIFIPTGDGTCVVLIGVESPADIHIQIALGILERINAHNAVTQDEMRRFKVRIGIDANTDTLVVDINRRQNIAGEGISMASRIMNLADEKQILVGQNVYNTLRQRQKYISAFKDFRTTVKHGKPLQVYQLISEGLNNDVPRALMPEEVAHTEQETATPAVNKAECPDKKLHEIAESDKRRISKYVWIIYRRVEYEGLTATDPYIEIIFDIINASVYSISIDKKIEQGAVYLNNEELNPQQTKIDGSLQNISRDDRGDSRGVLVIKQWLTPTLAARIRNPLPDDELHFSRLSLIVKGADDSEGIAPQRLSLPRSIPIALSSPSGPDKWLHDIAELQKGAIRDHVQAECRVQDFNLLHDSSLYIDFRLRIASSCVYKLSLKRVQGYIHFSNRPFHDPPTVASNEIKKVSIGEVGWLTLRQKMKPEEAGFILSSSSGFSFNQLQIELSAEPGDIESGPLYISGDVDSSRMKEETPQLTMEVSETRASGLYDREEYPGESSPEFGSVLNIKVSIRNPRAVPVEIKRFMLLTVIGEQRRTSAQEGQICDITLLQFGEIKQTRNPLKNLNKCPVYLDPNSETLDGWLQFIVRDVASFFWGSGDSVFLIVLDSRGEEHRHEFVPSHSLVRS